METPAAKSLDSLRVEDASLAVITVLNHEFVALRAALAPTRQLSPPPFLESFHIEIANVPSKLGGSRVVLLVQQLKMGNNSSAVAATLIGRLGIKRIIFCGIAGAVPNPKVAESHVRLGDVVIPSDRGVLQYDNVKEHEGGRIEIRAAMVPPDIALLRAAKTLDMGRLVESRPWEAYAAELIAKLGKKWERPDPSNDKLREGPFYLLKFWKGRKEVPHPVLARRVVGQPVVFQGVIGSANILLKNPAHRDRIRDQYGVRAIEMEASGVADASEQLSTHYFIVRGTCDYCNSDKNDNWHNYAAVVAAAYSRALLEQLPPSLGGEQIDPQFLPPSQHSDGLPPTALLSAAPVSSQIPVSFPGADPSPKSELLDAIDRQLLKASTASESAALLANEIRRVLVLGEFEEAKLLGTRLEGLLSDSPAILPDVRSRAFAQLANLEAVKCERVVAGGAKADTARLLVFIQRARDGT